MNKSRVLKYLKSKDSADYTKLDRLLKQYIDGDLNRVLSKYNFTDVEIYANVSDGAHNLEFYFAYQNIAIDIEINEYRVEYRIYPQNVSAEEYDKNISTIGLEDDFSFEEFVNEIYSQVINHPQLKDVSKEKSKKRIYKIVSTVSLLIGIVTALVISLSVLISKESLNLTPWLGVFLIIMLLLWFIFDIKSNRNQ